MEIIVFTADWDIDEEASKINLLFQEGLGCLHLRKPSWSKQQCVDLLHQINSNYHSRIMVHQYHDLAIDFSLQGIHLKEQQRTETQNLHQYVSEYQQKGFQVSTGFHDITKLEAHLSIGFNYTFLSPVYTSISKKNYHGKNFCVKHLDHKIIGLGGVTPNNIQQLKYKGFTGAAVLGSIWKNNQVCDVFLQVLENTI